MPNTGKSRVPDGLHRLLNRLADIDRRRAPKCMPGVIADQWLQSDPDARRQIEEAIDQLPKKFNRPTAAGVSYRRRQ